MLFDTYESKGLLFNMNVKEGDGKYAIYRGDLVLTQGEVGDALGHRKPPTATVKNTVVLAEDDKIKFFAGSLDDLADLTKVMTNYQADLAPDARLLVFVVNIAKPLIVDLAGFSIAAIPLQEGVIWNELMDLAALEKGDFKGQSALQKVVTVYGALSTYQPKGDKLAFEEALTRVVDSLRRAGRGPV
jgi:hypothetical protein